ncbi:transketolase [Streptomyces sp. OF3]|uniref:Transketolase n=1 Tax=Streptomyces alkaliterrae TaxID=2213162 RepID=A0A7W3WJ35_9ACTN|nr:1-deoxy-D-xylulose-5-phosphate synthase N-terminal domain-containing protein [Streptomyces alkaliterrae]MBB1253293.1 transketolase [Streptomyces alkaliterrae]
MSTLRTLVHDEATAALPRLTPAEAAVVRRELAELAAGELGGELFEQMRKLAAAVPGRLYDDSAHVLLRMHEIAGSGNLQSNLSSLSTVRACFDLGLVGGDTPPAELVVGRGHIAPAFYAEHYVRGAFPFAPLTTLHRGGLTGVVHRDLGFGNTMRYSLGVGVHQAVGLAWELRRRGDGRKVVCLAGDGELQEGSAFEALRFAHEADLDNLVLVVDANGKGIEPLAKPVSRDYLAAYLGRVAETDGTDDDAVRDSLESLLAAPGRAALVCRTLKGAHSFRPPSAAGATGRPSFSQTTGPLLADRLRRTKRQAAVFTADMAARFGFKDHLPYVNTGLAETLSVGLTLSLPDPTLKVVATDGMYYMDSLSMLTEATTGARNLLVLAGKSHGQWGGAHNAVNLLGGLLNTRVYEPVTAAEFQACLDRLDREPGTAHVVSAVDAKFEPPLTDCSDDLDGAVWVTPPAPGRSGTAVVTFGYAGVLVSEANADLGVPHLHCAALEPRLPPETVALLAGVERLLTVEYNGVQGGFGERLRSRHLLDAEVHGIRTDILTCAHAQQLRRHGMAPDQLRALLGAAPGASEDEEVRGAAASA